jgi:hypothetical protein
MATRKRSLTRDRRRIQPCEISDEQRDIIEDLLEILSPKLWTMRLEREELAAKLAPKNDSEKPKLANQAGNGGANNPLRGPETGHTARHGGLYSGNESN